MLYLYTKKSNRVLAFVALLFVPLYGIINIVVYSTQVIILPLLARNLDFSNVNPSTIYFITQLVHKGDTVFGMLNAVAYAILGVPSVLFALLIYKKNQFGKIAAIFLIFNAFACILGVIGGAVGNPILSLGVMFGGLLFTIAVLFVFFMTRPGTN